MRMMERILKDSLAAPWPRFVTLLSLMPIMIGIPLVKDWPSLWRLLIADGFFLGFAFSAMYLHERYFASRPQARSPGKD